MHSLSPFERDLISEGHAPLAGLDEAGRGPLAGPVTAAAVIFHPDTHIEGMEDSKKLTPLQRTALAADIQRKSLAWAVSDVDVTEIDRINILQASILAMHRAVEQLALPPGFLLVDGNRFHHPRLPFRTIVKGDSLCFSIAAASILAKVHRDALMDDYDQTWPAYGFARHRGYATAAHVAALREHGPCPIHRRSFTVRALVHPTDPASQEALFDDRATSPDDRTPHSHRHGPRRRNPRG